jgi:hypothetical protein
VRDRHEVRLWLVALLWPSLARAEPERSLEVMTLVGASAHSPVSRWSLNHYDPRPNTDDTMGDLMLGISIAWEADPTAYPLQPLRLDVRGKPVPEGRFVKSPEFSLQTHGTRLMALGGMRLEAVMDYRETREQTTMSSIRMWITPHVGAVTGVASPVVGFDYVTVFQVGRTWGLAMVMGLNFWHGPELELFSKRVTEPPSNVWIGQVFGGFAFTLRL